jgi:DNA/RNA endonuclease YhcR with UshA esterase domain
LRYHQASDFRGFQGGEYMKANAARTLLLLCLLGSATLFWARAASAETTAASGAKNHIGEKATVCGKVVSAHYAARSRSQPTFLNLDKPYPQQIFTIVIWGFDRPKFAEPEAKYQGKSVCVTGEIKEYRGVPEVVASAPAQIRVQKYAGEAPAGRWGESKC